MLSNMLGCTNPRIAARRPDCPPREPPQENWRSPQLPTDGDFEPEAALDLDRAFTRAAAHPAHAAMPARLRPRWPTAAAAIAQRRTDLRGRRIGRSMPPAALSSRKRNETAAIARINPWEVVRECSRR